jgi:hypothetical protein
MQYEVWDPAKSSQEVNTDLVVGMLVAMHHEAPYVGRALRNAYMDARSYGYPVIIGANFAVGSDPDERQNTKTVMRYEHERLATVPTHFVDMGAYDNEASMGMLRRDFLKHISHVCTKKLGVNPDGGKTLVFTMDADATDISPLGSFFRRFVEHAELDGGGSVYYAPVRHSLSENLPPNLGRVADLDRCLLEAVRPYIHEGASAFSLKVYNGSRGFRPEWKSGEGGAFVSENKLSYVPVPNTQLSVSFRRNEYLLSCREVDPYLLGFGPDSKHRNWRQLPELTIEETRFLIDALVERNVQRCVRHYAADGVARMLYGFDTVDERTEARDRAALAGARVLRKADLADHAAALYAGIRLVDVRALTEDLPIGLPGASSGRGRDVLLPELPFKSGGGR